MTLFPSLTYVILIQFCNHCKVCLDKLSAFCYYINSMKNLFAQINKETKGIEIMTRDELVHEIKRKGKLINRLVKLLQHINTISRVINLQ